MTRYLIMIGIIVGLTAMAVILSFFENTSPKMEILTMEDIILEIAKYKQIRNTEVNIANIEMEYIDLDFDNDLDLMISYRTAIDNGIFLIYEYKDKKFQNVFNKNWAIEQMNYGSVTVAETDGNDIFQVKAHIINLINGAINESWEGVITRLDYSNLDNITELRGGFYVDDLGVLHYFYIINGVYNSEEYIWKDEKFILLDSP